MATQQQPKPNPSLRRSLSDSEHRRRRRRATISTTSSKSSWSSKLGKLLARLALFSRDSDLTEESLEAHNKRYNDLDILDKTPKSSPYYRGLTDSSLAINYHHGPLTSTPLHVTTTTPRGPHTYAASAATSTQSSLVAKFKDYWAPCLRKQQQQPNGPRNPNKEPRQHQRIQTVTTTTVVAKSTSFSLGSTSASFKEERKESRDEVERKKLLRERLVTNGGRRGGGGGGGVAAVVEMEKERYSWGDKYRPKVLEDFICNRKRAIELKEMVKEKGCGHYYIFEGAPGVGKRTMIQAMLRQAFGHQPMEVYYQYDLINLPSSPHIYI